MDLSDSNRARFYEKLLMLMPAYVYWKDANHQFLGCNENEARLFKLDSPSSIVGKKNSDLFKPELAQKIEDIDQYVMQSGLAKSFEEVGVDEAGNEAIYFTTKTPIFDDETGNVVGLLGVSIDVTAERESQRLQLEKEKMEEGAKFLRIAMGAIAHDLRTPLASIKFVLAAINNVFADLLAAYQLAIEHHLVEKPLRKDKLKLFKHSVDRGLREIDFANNYIDLTLANVRHDRIVRHDYKELDIVTEVTRAVEAYPFKDDERDLVSWQPTYDFTVYANEFYLRNMMNNLLKNALFFIKKNRRGNIEITTYEAENYHVLEVKDTAEGIAPEFIDKIFDGYYTQRQNGTGLGLTFCKSVMQDFGGDIQVESVYGEYAKFNLYFPKDIAQE